MSHRSAEEISTALAAEQGTSAAAIEPSTSVSSWRASDQHAANSTAVLKCVDPALDSGNLLLEDFDPLDIERLKHSRESYLLEVARENTQVLINRIWELPTERKEDVVVAQLPEPTYRLPREKPVPKKKPLTKWQKYARMKGIRQKKKSRMVWDEVSQTWKPRWGYKRANDETKDWLMEVPDNATNPNEDVFAKKLEARKENIAKNELKRMRNITRSMKGTNSVPGVGMTPLEDSSSQQLASKTALAKKATASMGQFTEQLPKEKPPKNSGKRRKFTPNEGNMQTEKQHQLDIWSSMQVKKPKLDLNKIVSQPQDSEEQPRTVKKKSKSSKGKGGRNRQHGSKRKQKFKATNRAQHKNKGKARRGR